MHAVFHTDELVTDGIYTKRFCIRLKLPLPCDETPITSCIDPDVANTLIWNGKVV